MSYKSNLNTNLNTQHRKIAKNIFSKLQNASNIVLLTHTSLDPDALGSLLAMYFALKNNRTFASAKITPIIYEEPLENPTLQTLQNQDQHGLLIETLPDSENTNTNMPYSKSTRLFETADYILVLDTSTVKRAVPEDLQETLLKHQEKILIIDHHITPTDISEKYARHNFLQVPRPSTADLLYELMIENNFQLNYDIAFNLLYGILADTAQFRYLKNEHAFVLSYVQDLIKYLDTTTLQDIIQLLDIRISPNMLQYLQEATNNIRIENRVVSTFLDNIPQDVLKSDEFSDFKLHLLYKTLLSIKDMAIYISVMPSEKPNHYKISLRSAKEFDVSKIAQKFGGGGHKNASGCKIQASSANQALEMVLKEAEKVVEEMD